LQVCRGGCRAGRFLHRPRLSRCLGPESTLARGVLHPTGARERFERRLDVWIYLALARFPLCAVGGA
jgi:hypothetical protein